jgi:hypothetical protein
MSAVRKIAGVKSSAWTRRALPVLTKLAVVAILAAGLISISMYTSVAQVYAAVTKPHVITGDTPELVKHEGLEPEPQPWEDGMRTDPTSNTYEW